MFNFGPTPGLSHAVDESISEIVDSCEALAVVTKDFTVAYDDMSNIAKVFALRHICSFNEHVGVLTSLGFGRVGSQLARQYAGASDYANRLLATFSNKFQNSPEIEASHEEFKKRRAAAKAKDDAFDEEMERLQEEQAA